VATKAIEVSSLKYTYPECEKPVLVNINFSVRKGEVLGIMGPTGAGKTTLCLCLAGLIPHSVGGKLEGEVKIEGIKTTEHELNEFINKIGFVFQDPELQLFGITVKEDVAMRLKNMGLEEEEVNKRVKWALEQVKLKGFERRFPYSLSGGEKQRVAIAGALAAFPEILILDEPTSELDPIGKREVFDVINSLKEEFNTTVVIVEHNAEELVRVADKLIILKAGEIVLNGNTSDVLREIKDDVGLRMPDVSILGHYLRSDAKWQEYGYPLKIEEAYSSLIKIFNKYGIRRKHPPLMFNYGANPPTISEKLNKPIVEARDLTYIYGHGTDEEKTALQGISLKIYEGEFIALIGQNGSGKTTLAKHMNGLLKPTKGSIIVKGMDTRKTPIHKLAKVVGYCFQNPDHQIFKFRVHDEVAFGPRNLLLPEDEVANRVKEALKIVGLEGYENSNPFFLGKGERQKIAVASILAMQPDIMIIDEPTTGMDHKSAINMMNLLKQLNEKGKTIIFITHDMYIVAEYAKRVITLHEGKVVLDGPPEYVFTQVETLERISIKPPQITQLAYLLRDYINPNILNVKEAYEQLKSLESNSGGYSLGFNV
jgi:energy-coupling factor transport system ATP-binding protein